MESNPLIKLTDFGQSIWLDFTRRAMLVSGELQKLISEDGLRGMTSNPSIFEKAIGGSHDYDEAIRALAQQGKSAAEMYEIITVQDIQQACDQFRPTYDRLKGRDGFVSIEVSPYLAHDTDGTIAEAHRLWAKVNRPNVMIKVPATQEGLPAIRQLTREGINVNITLLFGLGRYRDVVEAYITGLEARLADGQPIDQIASVASFFLSRIDVLVDPLLEKEMQGSGSRADLAHSLHGQAAIASAKIAYQIFKEVFGNDRFKRLAGKGAHTQRVLWASTSTKNPAYSDVKYVEPLIGPDTINTVPMETLDAYRDHGNPASRLEEGVDQAHKALTRLPELGIHMDQVTQQLEDEGVAKFIKAFDQLAATLQEKALAALQETLDRQAFELGDLQSAVQQQIAHLKQEQFSNRLWRKDASLWLTDPQSQAAIRNSLGWLHVAEKMEEELQDLSNLAGQAYADGLRHMVLLGMGGSSLAPLVFQRTFSSGSNGLSLTVLDTTDPATILKVQQQAPLDKTLFIVSSKSGTTTETHAFGEYFYAQLHAIRGDRAGENMIAITDPGTPLAKLAQERHYRRVFLNYADIGGRYSALSYFGLVPAVLMGLDVSALLDQALRMTHACAPYVPTEQNPGLTLGAVLGKAGRQGQDKVTFLMPEPIATLGMWLEQLLAESTGKGGTGLLPVAGEPLGDPAVYGTDRLFVQVRLDGAQDVGLESGVAALQQAGHPLINIHMQDRIELGQEFFRWEVATATAGAILGINPFDQPNVQESKDNTKRILDLARERGRLPEEERAITGQGLSLYTGQPGPDLTESVAKFLGQARPGDYIALMAYLPEMPATERALQAIRLQLRDNLRLATTLGYGPRFLHSTGQFHKGGTNNGLFLQITADDAQDIAVPGEPYSFGTLKRAQALGDLQALRKHDRRVARVHLGADPERGLAALQKVLEAALDSIGVREQQVSLR